MSYILHLNGVRKLKQIEQAKIKRLSKFQKQIYSEIGIIGLPMRKANERQVL